MRYMISGAVCAALFALAALPAQAEPATHATLMRGKAIAQANCGKCHAIGPTGASPARAERGARPGIHFPEVGVHGRCACRPTDRT